MKLIRTVIVRYRRPPAEIETMSERLLDDIGIERPKARGLMDAMMSSFGAAYAVEMIRER